MPEHEPTRRRDQCERDDAVTDLRIRIEIPSPGEEPSGRHPKADVAVYVVRSILRCSPNSAWIPDGKLMCSGRNVEIAILGWVHHLAVSKPHRARIRLIQTAQDQALDGDREGARIGRRRGGLGPTV